MLRLGVIREETYATPRGVTNSGANTGAAEEPDIALPEDASRGRRRGHLYPTDGSAAYSITANMIAIPAAIAA